MTSANESTSQDPRANWFQRQWKYLKDPKCRGGWKKLFVCLPSIIDSAMRRLDHFLGNSYGGPWQRLFMNGHSMVPFLFMFAAIGFTVYGPTPRYRGVIALAALIVAVLIFWGGVRRYLARRQDGRGLLTFQILLIGVLTALLFGWPATLHTVEADPALYRHVYAPAVVALLLFAAVSYRIAAWVLRDFPESDRARFRALLAATELFVKPRDPAVDGRKILYGLLGAPVYHPLHLLLLPAIGVIVVKPENVAYVAWGLLGLSWLLLTFTGVHERLSLMIAIVRRWFLVGGQLVVSLAIIALAAARLFKVDYVTTLLDSTPGAVIISYVVSAYAAFWLYEYWINRALTERMLAFLAPSDQLRPRAARIDYPIERGQTTTDVMATGRAIEIFSGSRFVVTGSYQSSDYAGQYPAWQSYDKSELFERLAARAQSLANCTPDDRYQVRAALGDLRKRVKLYFNVLNIGLIGLVVGVGVLLHRIPERAEAVGSRIDPSHAEAQPVSLKDLIFANRGARDKVVMLAASGGGTRAALYAASVLHGIARLGRANDVVLLSGVSGGSAALADFAIHRADLLATDPSDCTAERLDAAAAPGAAAPYGWCAYFAAMGNSYIEDVLRGVSEVDVAMSKSLGHVLDESFVRGFGLSGRAAPRLTDVSGVGVIFNTTLAGHPATASRWLNSLYLRNPEARGREYSIDAGTRLIFTNVRDLGAFPRATDAAEYADDAYLKYVIVGGPKTTVTAAAALSANFPPVFSNGAVDIAPDARNGAGERYWVTDGGAADNRGIVSLLYALLGAIDECEKSAGCGRSPPEIHVIVADASAETIDYRSDRGGGSILGAANKFASQLMLALIARAKDEYGKLHGKLEVHYLPMPAVLRMRGGLGTHWMMPESVTLKDICAPNPNSAATVDVDRVSLLRLIWNLHPREVGAAASGHAPECAPGTPPTAAAWVARDSHAQAWAQIVAALKK